MDLGIFGSYRQTRGSNANSLIFIKAESRARAYMCY
ncbi:hypothetical protein QE379_002550 [Sphingomonas sp. SORGH_AS 879]|nr:hypothetical protein [Sphingomonas sp. SORGH_AS_0879]